MLSFLDQAKKMKSGLGRCPNTKNKQDNIDIRPIPICLLHTLQEEISQTPNPAYLFPLLFFHNKKPLMGELAMIRLSKKAKILPGKPKIAPV